MSVACIPLVSTKAYREGPSKGKLSNQEKNRPNKAVRDPYLNATPR